MSSRFKKNEYISVVVPVLNEENNLPVLYRALKQQLKLYRHEILFVNDGSTDGSAAVITKLRQKDTTVKLINLSRNFGHQIAITCGLDYARGDAAIIMDADLQDPPRLLSQLITTWQQGYDVVYGIRKARKGEPLGKLVSAGLFYQLLNLLSPTKIPQNVGDFRLISKRVVEVLRYTREYQRFLRGMISWVGFKQIGITYEREKRLTGNSKYPTWKMIRLALDALFSFSLFPLRIATLLGTCTAFGAFLYSMYAVIITTQGKTVRGWSSTIVLMLFLGSVQLISLGIIGEYLGRIYEEIKQRPLYIIDSVVGISSYNYTLHN